MVSFNATCNSTLDDLRIGGSEKALVGSFTFHSIGLVVAAACSLIAIIVSLYLIFMHATHYTKPYEQRQFARSSPPFLASANTSQYYPHPVYVYFQVISDCYEAFAIASFFSLLCHYIAPNLHDQKQYFRTLQPKGWVLVIESVAVTIAMFCLIQFYVQLRLDLSAHSPFIKVIAIKLVIFLSFWQTFLISILTSATFNVVHTTASLAYPDLKVGVPSLLLCIEMAIFAILHIFAFPYKPYMKSRDQGKYPVSPSGPGEPPVNTIGPNQGGFMGWKAIADAMNPWDLVKGFARAMRWLFVGRKNRLNDPSYFINAQNENDMALEGERDDGYKVNDDNLPIAQEFRRSRFGMLGGGNLNDNQGEEGARLIANAQPHPLNPGSGYIPARQRYDSEGQDISQEPIPYDGKRYTDTSPDRLTGRNPTPGSMNRKENQQIDIGTAVTMEPEPYESHVPGLPYPPKTQSELYLDQKREARRQQSPPEQRENASSPTGNTPEVHNALWGSNSKQPDDTSF
ncbi:hypothetical protein G7Y89_g3797 [Cudoniella acicularis]|uniref:Transmembrane protein n=1 Tax=Cudoniella acicularis TaxID=354080 RepID=A0A8H4W599_9HELO|nr:hypothetical protein G7Y89_g3797 [Cudoniella acicularis]